MSWGDALPSLPGPVGLVASEVGLAVPSRVPRRRTVNVVVRNRNTSRGFLPVWVILMRMRTTRAGRQRYSHLVRVAPRSSALAAIRADRDPLASLVLQASRLVCSGVTLTDSLGLQLQALPASWSLTLVRQARRTLHSARRDIRHCRVQRVCMSDEAGCIPIICINGGGWCPGPSERCGHDALPSHATMPTEALVVATTALEIAVAREQ